MSGDVGHGQTWPLWDTDPSVQRGLVSFAEYLTKLGRCGWTTRCYVEHVARGWRDPVAYLERQRSNVEARRAKMALVHYCRHRGMLGAVPVLQAVPLPLRGPRRQVHVPDLELWRELGPRMLRAHPGPVGHTLWVLCYSGLRVGDLLSLRRGEAESAAGGSETVIRQKGYGRRRERIWRPVSQIRPALRRLVADPGWSTLHELICPDARVDPIKRASAALRKCIPPPTRPHDFRRAFATYHYAITPDLVLIAQMGGWDSAASVERYIVHIPRERLEYFRRRFERLLFPQGRTPYD